MLVRLFVRAPGTGYSKQHNALECAALTLLLWQYITNLSLTSRGSLVQTAFRQCTIVIAITIERRRSDHRVANVSRRRWVAGALMLARCPCREGDTTP